MRFADEDFPRFVHLTPDGNVGTQRYASLRTRHRHRDAAEHVLAEAGTPWSIPLAEDPHVVELDIAAKLHKRAAKLRDELTSIEEELAQTYTYPSKERSDAGA
jgi:hypothetical protein